MCNNSELRNRMKECGIAQWQVAEALGVAESTLCRRLRRELPEDEKSRVLSVVEKLAEVRA